MSKSAFPSPSINGEAGRRGMNLLEYYAGQASNLSPYKGKILDSTILETLENYVDPSHKGHSKWCFDRAAAMVKEAEKRSQQKGDLK